MDIQRFTQQLSDFLTSPQFNDFGLDLTQFPIENPKLLKLLNLAVQCLDDDEIYCQIGCSNPVTVVGAITNQPDLTAFVVEPDDKLEELTQVLSILNLPDQVFFFQQNFEEFFFDLQENQNEETDNKIGFYFCESTSDYRSQLLQLLLVLPFLSDEAVIIINNSNNSGVQQASWDFLVSHSNCKLLLNLGSSLFGNGLIILHWNINQSISYSWSDLKSEFRNENFIQNFTDFQVNNFEILSKTISSKLEQEALENALSGNLKAAESNYLQVLEWQKNNHKAWHNLALVYYQMSEAKNALKAILKALMLEPLNPSYYYTLGLVQEKLGQKNKAIKAYNQTIKLDPHYIDTYGNLGNIFAASSQIDLAESTYRQAIIANPFHIGTQVNLINILQQGKYSQALKLCNDLLELKQVYEVDLYFSIIHNLHYYGLIQEAINFATLAANLFPNDFSLNLEKQRLIPIIYETTEELGWYRHQFTEYLDKLLKVSLDSVDKINQATKLIGRHTNFFLPYQGKNDLEIQKKYGEFVAKVMRANYPQWSQDITVPPLTEEGKIKIGYISSSMNYHVVGQLSVGWLVNHNRREFEIYCYYHKGEKEDSITEEFKNSCDVFYKGYSITDICEKIISDRLHILIFIDLGMEPEMTQIAGLRLAPIQCTTWLHPITSGLPTIDYFLSNQAMEAENGDEHYTEKLIRLPNLGIYYSKTLPEEKPTREQFNLSEQAIIYLCCQSLSKYLPQHDYIFPTIAQQVNSANFVFFQSRISNGITEKFQNRLKKAFAEYNLNSEDYCVILPRLDYRDYILLNLVSDIFLDTFTWSGGVTSLDAIACNLPIVTCKGEFFRSRQSQGILKLLGIEETIASDTAEYIDIAVKLGLDLTARKSIKAKIQQNNHLLYQDISCVRFLEQFYRSLVNKNT